jgi:hypothetical protein
MKRNTQHDGPRQECYYTECYAECCKKALYAESRYFKCRYAECRGACETSKSDLSSTQSVTKFMAMIAVNLVTLKVGAKHELLHNKLTSEALARA